MQKTHGWALALIKTMKLLITIISFFVLIGCKEQEDSISVTFPMYKECEDVLEQVLDSFSILGNTLKVKVEVDSYGASPKYGNISSGLGVISIQGDIEILDGSTKEELLQRRISSMYSACMPNNSVAIGDASLAYEVRQKLRGNTASIYLDGNQVWALVNDGSYRYMEQR